jgi:methylated-DNA-[protein]-cysteine S-methyltransferase
VKKYTIFETNWGYFGLAGTEESLFRSCLPTGSRRRAKRLLLGNCAEAAETPGYLAPLQRQIIAYFEGSCVDFTPGVPILHEAPGAFTGSVLTACRSVRYGETISYGRLARRAGRTRAARAAGSVLAANPLPLIIPCHRVVRSDGRIGGFSAAGGVSLKKRMLQLEQQGLTRRQALGRLSERTPS